MAGISQGNFPENENASRVMTLLPHRTRLKAVFETALIICFFFYWMVCAPLSGWPQELAKGFILEGMAIDVLYPKGFRAQALKIQEVYRRMKAETETAVGLKFTGKPTVILLADKVLFQKLTGSALIAAFAVPSRQSIVIYVPPYVTKAYLLPEIFKHEFCHLVLHQNIRGDFPRWLDEGVCQWVSGNIGELLAGGEIRPGRSAIAHSLIPLDELSINFPRNASSLYLAYDESLSFVGFVVKSYGKDRLKAILECLKDGENVPDAFLKALGRPLLEVEREWTESVKKGTGWLIWLSQHLYQVLFFSGAFLSILAFVRQKRRKKMYYEEEDF